MKIKCNNCKDIIEGDKRGTYISCKCGEIAIDETKYYCRVIGNKGTFEIIEEIKDDIQEQEKEIKRRNL